MKIRDITSEWIALRRRGISPRHERRRIEMLDALAVAIPALQEIAGDCRLLDDRSHIAPHRLVACRALDTEVGES